jgi:iron complex outermembrane receptor protein
MAISTADFFSFSSASLRGASSEQVMIYLDGLLLNDAAGGGVNLSNIDLLQVQAVEIYRGSTPVQLPQASLGGAINLRSRAPDESSPWRWRLGAGSFGEREAAWLGSARRDDWRTLLSLGWRTAVNDFPFQNDNGTDFNRDDDFDDHRRNSGVDQASLLLKLDRERGAQRLDMALQLFDKHQRIPDHRNAPQNAASLDTRIGRFQLNRRLAAVADTLWNLRLGMNLGRTIETYDDTGSTIGLGQQHDRWKTDLAGASAYGEYLGDGHTLAVTIDFRAERYRSEDLLELEPDSKARRHGWNLAVQDSRYAVDEKLLVTPALRYRAVADRFDVQAVSFGGARIDDRYRHDGLHPSVGVKYQFREGLALAANLGSYQRLPSFFELFGDRGLFLGNPALRPEEGVNADLLVQWRPETMPRGITRLDVEGGLFYSDVDDAISRVYNARGIGKSINIEGALVRGVEWSVAATFANHLDLHFKGTWQDAENRNRFPAFRGKQIPGQAASSVSLHLAYPLRRATVYYDFSGRYDRYYDTANLLPARDQAVHDVGIDWPIGPMKASLEIRNITDVVYEDFNGFPKPGRAFHFSLTYPGGST